MTAVPDPGFDLDANLPLVTLVLGGARSGKSTFAEELVARRGPGVYLATATAGDAEMEQRIRQHRERRGAAWRTVEEPLDLAAALDRHTAPDHAVLVDCLTLWLSNLMGAGRDVQAETARLTGVLAGLKGPVVFVSNEVGLGIVPDNELARAFRDHAGRLHQAVGESAGLVVFMVAGLPMVVKRAGA